jgi:serine/threonine-protein kinase
MNTGRRKRPTGWRSQDERPLWNGKAGVTTMPTPSHVDRQTFLTNLLRSGLVTQEEVARVTAELPDTPRGRVLARAFVERGLLTKFQAERLLVGRVSGFFLGQYRILDQLGSGGMGRVFKAEHRTMKRIVALKVLAPDLMRTARAQELFLHEVRAVAQLVHPNIVTAYDANEVQGRYYLVLEYVDGPNLDQLVRQQGPLPVGHACDFVRQIATGLQCAHNLGMLHRDIKPANMLLQTQGLQSLGLGVVKISDFGLARLHRPNVPGGQTPHTILTRDNTVMGTPDYLSPEQARNLHKTDIRSDLYSLGCTFYFLLSGQVPFPGGTSLEKLIRHSSEQPTPLSELRRDVPAPILAIVQRLMAKHPRDRFQTPAELATALEPYAVTGPTPWAPNWWKAEPGSEDVRTPVEGTPESELDAVGPSDELAALVNTVPPDLSPTPLTPTLSRFPALAYRGRVAWAILSATAIVAAVLSAFLVMNVLFSGK